DYEGLHRGARTAVEGNCRASEAEKVADASYQGFAPAAVVCPGWTCLVGCVPTGCRSIDTTTARRQGPGTDLKNPACLCTAASAGRDHHAITGETHHAGKSERDGIRPELAQERPRPALELGTAPARLGHHGGGLREPGGVRPHAAVPAGAGAP